MEKLDGYTDEEIRKFATFYLSLRSEKCSLFVQDPKSRLYAVIGSRAERLDDLMRIEILDTECNRIYQLLIGQWKYDWKYLFSNECVTRCMKIAERLTGFKYTEEEYLKETGSEHTENGSSY